MNKEIGERIKAIRLTKKLSPKDLGALIGMLDTSYSKIERGGNTTVKTILEIAQALEVSPADFFNEVQMVADPASKSGFATKDDFENLKRMFEDFARDIYERLPQKKVSPKTYAAKNKKPGQKKTQ